MKNIRIAAVVFNSVVNRTADNLAGMVPWIEQAKSRAAQLICFPELNVTGYSTKSDIKACAEPIPGRISQQLQQWARDHQIAILAGMAEKKKTAVSSQATWSSPPEKSPAFIVKSISHHRSAKFSPPALASLYLRLPALNWASSFVTMPISRSFRPIWPSGVRTSFSCLMLLRGERRSKNWIPGCVI